MISLSAKGELVKLQLEQAFGNVPYPGDDNILLAQGPFGPEDDLVLSILRGKHWRELTVEDLHAIHNSFYDRVTPQAFHFYLPAFLRAALDFMNAADLLQSSISWLTPPETISESTFGRWLQRLSADQKKAITEFFGYVMENGQSQFKDPEEELMPGFYFWFTLTEDEEEPATVKLGEKREILKLLIEKAFADVPYPGDENIALEHLQYEFDYEYFLETLRGKHWRQLTIDDIDSIQASSSYFSRYATPDAFCFYLPAFLIASLDYDQGILYNTVRTLAPSPEVTNGSKERDRKLTPLQRGVIKEFLEQVIADRKINSYSGGYQLAKEALSYWSDAAPSP